jgi:peptidoglycan hydrolase-like protein with peptidoglycan-binding domain
MAAAKKPRTYVQYTDWFGKKLRGDEFGNLAPYRNGRPHRGGDWAPRELSPIKAFCDGKVTNVFWSNVLGWVVEVLAADGIYTQYSHIAPKTVEVDKGEVIKAGDIVGKVGGGKKTPSGSASTGAHLHVAMGLVKDCHLADRSKLIDPFKWIDAHSKPAPVAADAAPAAPAAPATAPAVINSVEDLAAAVAPTPAAPAAPVSSDIDYVDEIAREMGLDIKKYPKLVPGAKNRYVAYVQRKFKFKVVNGVYDDRTKKAVVALQKKHGFVADGTFGKLTWNKVIDL